MKVLKLKEAKGFPIHTYKGFMLKKNGSLKNPWNIYSNNYDWLGFAETMQQAKADIDAGCYDEDVKKSNEFNSNMEKWRERYDR